MVGINPQDSELARKLRQHNVLQDVEGARLNQSKGIILVCCADGDQFGDIFAFQKQLMAPQRETPRIHPLTTHGGALSIPQDSPLSTSRYPLGRVLMHQIAEANGFKELPTVVLYAHAPCAAAATWSLYQVVQFLKRAGERVREELPHLQVVCLLHLDTGDGKKRSYFVSGSEWKNYTTIHR